MRNGSYRIILSALLLAAWAPAAPQSEQKASFSLDVLPILSQKCLPCHGETMASAGLELHTREGALKGGQNGVVIVPGDATNSRLYRRVTGQEEPQMPMGGQLSDEEVAAIKNWIDSGAEWAASVLVEATPAAQTEIGRREFSKGERTYSDPQEAAESAHSPSPRRALLDTYCITCHNERLRTAGFILDRIDAEDVSESGEAWENVLRKVRSGEMPPDGMPRPDQATLDAFASSLEMALDDHAAAHPNPGRVGVHRLNRTEYTNAIRDLLALEIDGRSLLLADDADKMGFENNASVLSFSSAMLERYMSAARKISRLAIGDPTIAPVFETYDIPKTLAQDDRMSEDLPFGSRGGTAIRHRFPVDGEYVIKIRLRRQLYDYILGLGRAHRLEVRLNGERIKVFTVGGEDKGTPAPATYAGNLPGDPEWEEYMHSADASLEVRFPARAGTWVVGVSFVKETSEPEGVLQPPTTGRGVALNEWYDGNAAVESVTIGGPYHAEGPGETHSRRRIFVCRPTGSEDEQPCAEEILSTLARRAYRRPVTEADVQTLLRFHNAGRSQGGFEAGIQLALQRLLVDPDFLFRIEYAPPKAAPGAVYRLSDIDLASRLSFFLWSSIPDDELLDLAARGELKDPGILQQQVRRMLADARSKALVDNFVSQWLNLPKLRGTVPDPEVFPDFDENLRQAFQRETTLFVESRRRADRSVVDLLNANYTFVNERLARHYQIPGIYGSHFRRLTFSDEKRGGLLGQGSILTVTSYPNRTSPVLRGKWLLDNILGMPPPPPPPNVPALKESAENGKASSLRERLEQHRENPACAVCHARMDPLGFALENFDAIGKWRTTSGGKPIDASGAFPDGTQFQDMAGLKKLLLRHREKFVGTFTERLLTYALGRGVEYYDLPAIRTIMREAAATDFRWSSLSEGIVNSVPFQMSIVSSPESQMKRSAE